MGLFDDDSQYDRPEKPGREAGPSKFERKHGMSHRDVLRNEFGPGRWTTKQVGCVVVLVIIAGLLFVSHFGTNTATYQNQFKQAVGMRVTLPGRVLAAPRVDAVKMSWLEQGAPQQGPAKMVGISDPGSCYPH